MGDVLIVGGDEVSYGQKPQGAAPWREKMLAEVAKVTSGLPRHRVVSSEESFNSGCLWVVGFLTVIGLPVVALAA